MPQTKRFRLKKIGVFAASEERFRLLEQAIGEPCVWLSEHLTAEIPPGIGEVVLDAGSPLPEGIPERRSARRPRRERAPGRAIPEAGRFISRGRLFIFQCPEHID